jgi:RNA polymerase sigma-70 factor (ECF subfamily)
MTNIPPVLNKNTLEVADTVANSKQEAAYDAELAQRFNNGDESAFVEIMQRYRGKIYGLTLSMLRNASDAEEITQDTFIRAHRGLARFRGDSSLSTWLYRIALNLSRNRYWYFFRRRRQDSISLERELGDGSDATFADLIAADTHDPLQETATSEFSELIARCMERLEAKHREILNMRNVLNLSYEDIARTLAINVGTVKSRIARARENLRTLLSEMCPEFAPDASPGDYFIAARTAYGRPTIAYA